MCPRGYFCPNVNTMTQCLSGYSCQMGSTSATACPTNSYCLAGASTTCTFCPLGTYAATACSSTADTVCEACPANAYCPGDER